jgi:hypothetical protein
MPLDGERREPIGNDQRQIASSDLQICECGGAAFIQPSSQIGPLQISSPIGSHRMQSHHIVARNCPDCRRKSRRFQSRVHGVASLRMRPLKIEQIARLLAYSRATKPNSRRRQRSQSRHPKGCGCRCRNFAHTGSSFSG